MIKIGIVPCQNGLGHISRCIDLSNELSKKYSVFLISNLRKNKKFNMMTKYFISKNFNIF